MRNLLIVVVLMVTNSLLATDEPLIHVGEEIDFVQSAINLLPDTRPVPGVSSSSTGSRFSKEERELFGWYVCVVDSSRNAMVPSWISVQLIHTLKTHGWTVSASPIDPTAGGQPVSFLGEAEKDGSRITFLITIFTADDGVVRVSYSQRRSVK